MSDGDRNTAERIRLPDPNLIGGMTPWEVDFRQLEPGRLDTTLRVRQGAVLTLLEIHMNRAVHQNGIAPPDTVTLGIPGSAGQLRWQGKDVTPAEMISFGSSGGFDGVSKARFLGLTFSAPLSAVEALAERLGLSLADSLWESGVFPDRTDNRQLRHATALACHYLSGGAPMNRNIEEEMIACLLRVSAVTGGATDRSSSRTRVRAVRLALDVMEANVEENPPIGDICDCAEVSERTLNRAFNERFDIGPKAYFLRMRLSRMRHDLLHAGDSETISDIANRWGFWHMGQLAREYGKQFGELPSETIRKPSRHLYI